MLGQLKSAAKKVLFSFLITRFDSKKTPRITSHVGICTLLCHDHIDFFICNIQSLFYQIKENFPIYVVDDGTLTPQDIHKLNKHFTLIYESHTSSERRMIKMFKKYENIFEFRFDTDVNPLRKKLDAFFLNPFDRYIYIDADVLFYDYPKEIVNWLKSDENVILYTAHVPYPINFYDNSEAEMEYSCRLLINEHYSSQIDPSFNSGLLCIPNKHCIDRKILNGVLDYFYKKRFAYTVVAEETAIYLSFSSVKKKKLPVKQYINAWCYKEYEAVFSNNTISIHYSGYTKYDAFQKDAIKVALKHNLFRSANQTV